MDGDAPEPDARHAFVGEADPTDALPAFEHTIVTNADCSELKHTFWPFAERASGRGFTRTFNETPAGAERAFSSASRPLRLEALRPPPLLPPASQPAPRQNKIFVKRWNVQSQVSNMTSWSASSVRSKPLFISIAGFGRLVCRHPSEEAVMIKLDDRTIARMD